MLNGARKGRKEHNDFLSTERKNRKERSVVSCSRYNTEKKKSSYSRKEQFLPTFCIANIKLSHFSSSLLAF